MRKPASAIVSGVLFGALLTAPAPAAAAPPDALPGPVHVDLVSGNGSGCPDGRLAIETAPDGWSFDLVFEDYVALVGPSAKLTASRQNCQAALSISGPVGYTFAVSQAINTGFAQIEPGATARRRAHYYFAGMPQTGFLTQTLAGPFAGEWQLVDQSDLAWIPWAPCGESRYLNIASELRMYAGTSDPTTTMSSITMNRSRYELLWKQCP